MFKLSTGTLLAALLWLQPAPPQGPSKTPMSLDAFAINMANMGRRGTGLLHIRIERWSTDEERDKLKDALVEKGSGALLSTLKALNPRAGFISSPGSLGWNIQYAREHVLPTGGRRIVIATDRPMQFWEASQATRSSDYDFMLAEIHVTAAAGKGEGKLVPMAKISYNKDQRSIEIENYAALPVTLGEVKVNP